MSGGRRADKAPKKSRRKAREFAIQGLYQWKLAAGDANAILSQLREEKEYPKIDEEHLAAILHGVIAQEQELNELIAPFLDRPANDLSPVEHAILLLAAFEMLRHLDIPYRVVINEAVELAKTYGGTDGHKFVNGVLDKLAAQVRAVEVNAKLEPQRR
ncbi:MAG: transcription antitermination factor NusB [Sulfuricella sp.]|nr:transcription antitermination factor NusB [Sulfuricella sp.]